MKRPARLVPATAPPVGADRRVKHVPVETRKLLDISVDYLFDSMELLDVSGAVVWVRPNMDTTPEQMAVYVRRLQAAGASRVLPLPLLTQDAAAPHKMIVRAKASNARAVVEELLEHVTEQADDVRMIVMKALEESGL